jgi:hypothetical protein
VDAEPPGVGDQRINDRSEYGAVRCWPSTTA